MTDRDQAGGSLPNACPFLALEDDRDRRSAVPDGRHRCFAESTPLPRALAYQESFCLSAAFPSCRSFLDWAARAAAEPVHGGTHGAGPGSMPLPPIPEAPQTPFVPVAAGGPAGSVASPPPVLMSTPPPPPASSPPPAWQPPGAARQDPTVYPWASPPPWVAEPEMRSTASLPSSARPPLDPERPDWGTTQSADPWLSEDPPPFDPWPPSPPRPTQLTGTFAARRGVEWMNPPAAGPQGPAFASAAPDWPPAPASPPAPVSPPAPSSPPAAVRDASPTGPPAQARMEAPVPSPVQPASPAPVAPTASLTASPAAAPGPVSWPEIVEDPAAWPARPDGPATWAGEPVAIPVGAGPGSPTPTWPVDHGQTWPDDPSRPPDADPAGPVQPPGAVPSLDAGSPPAGGHAASATPVASRRQPASRWLPSFLSGQAPPTDPAAGAGIVARTGPTAGVAAEAAAGDVAAGSDGAGPWSAASGHDPLTDDPAEPWSDAIATVPWPPVMGHDAGDDHLGMSAVEPDPWAVDAAASEAVLGPEVSAPAGDPPGALAPRRRSRPGVPVDSNAPVSVGAQTSATPRAKGSGEWNRSRRQGVKTGIRGIIPGVIPPVALGAVVLFLVAAFLFLVPGFFAGSSAPTPAPSLATDAPAVVDASRRPAVTPRPASTDAPTGAFDTYTVKGGDTLGAIARRFSVTQEQLICVNKELRRNPNLLLIGQSLQIPPADYVCPTPTKTKKP